MSNPKPRSEAELKIGDLERRTGVPRSSIQHYVRLGLLPQPRKLGPKLFLFDAQHVELLPLVRKLREVEKLPLTEIRARLRGGHVQQALRASSRPSAQPATPSRDPRRDAILEVATRLFTQHGYDSVRLQDIGRELHLSKAALYRSFDSKEALFVECIERIRLLVVPKRARDENQQIEDLAQRALPRAAAVLNNYDSYRMLTHLLVSVANARDRALADKARSALHAMVTDVVPELRQAAKQGLYREGDSELDAYMFWGALMSAGDYMRFVRPRPVGRIARAFIELFALGTTPRASARPRRR